jgi:hypothetical protein
VHPGHIDNLVEGKAIAKSKPWFGNPMATSLRRCSLVTKMVRKISRRFDAVQVLTMNRGFIQGSSDATGDPG